MRARPIMSPPEEKKPLISARFLALYLLFPRCEAPDTNGPETRGRLPVANTLLRGNIQPLTRVKCTTCTVEGVRGTTPLPPERARELRGKEEKPRTRVGKGWVSGGSGERRGLLSVLRLVPCAHGGIAPYRSEMKGTGVIWMRLSCAPDRSVSASRTNRRRDDEMYAIGHRMHVCMSSTYVWTGFSVHMVECH